MNKVNNFCNPFHYINNEGVDTVVEKKYQNRAKIAAIVGGILTLGLAAAPILYGMAAYYRGKCLNKSQVQNIDHVAQSQFGNSSEWEGKFHIPDPEYKNFSIKRADGKFVDNDYNKWIKPMQKAFKNHSPQSNFDLVLPVSVHRHRAAAFSFDGQYPDPEFRKEVDNPKTLVLYVSDGSISYNEPETLKAKYYVMSWKEYDQLPKKIPAGLLAILNAENPENHS